MSVEWVGDNYNNKLDKNIFDYTTTPFGNIVPIKI